MAGSCEGFNPTDTAMCEACHREGGTWVIRPDGSYICSKTSWPEDNPTSSGLSTGKKVLAFLGGFVVLGGAVLLWRRYGGKR
jgi:hypothetical protein